MDHWHTPHVGVSSRAVASCVVERTSAFVLGHAFGGACHNTDKTNHRLLAVGTRRARLGVCPTGIWAQLTICRATGLDRTGILSNSTKFRHCGLVLLPSIGIAVSFGLPNVYGGSIYPRCFSFNTSLFLRLIGNGNTAC